MKTTITKFFILLMIITLAACSKEGDPGPKGDAGPAGVPGPQGGKGDPGTANVIYSAWMPIDWNGFNESNYKTMKIEEPMITSEFIENGGVAMFFLRATSDDVTLVVSTPYQAGEVLVFGATQIQSGEGTLGLVASTADGSSFSEEMFEGLEVRYILIPGGTLTPAGKVSYDYESLKKTYQIQD